jgi:transcriptional regulator
MAELANGILDRLFVLLRALIPDIGLPGVWRSGFWRWLVWFYKIAQFLRERIDMYVPPAFKVTDTQTMWRAVEAHPLGLLISNHDGGLVANPVPFEVSHTDGGTTLRTHLARANPQWGSINGKPTLIVFHGADAYISPQWYETKKEHGRVVPTWNYSIIQIRGVARVVEDREWLLALVSRFTDHHEQRLNDGQAWKVTDAPADYIQSQLKGIVGVEINVVDIVAKRKASQNRSAGDRNGVLTGLRLGQSSLHKDMGDIIDSGRD